MIRHIIFNHIPKTGGTTLRIILNRAYESDKVYFINNKTLGPSLKEFGEMSAEQRNYYDVIAGVCAEKYAGMIENPFRVNLMREPLSLFFSQYYYLKMYPVTMFYKEVSQLASIEEYLDYALARGQDNLLTRHYSDSMDFLINPELAVPDMEIVGKELLQKAVNALNDYDALINLAHFDDGIYVLSRKLEWPGIPFYRPSNRNRRKKPGEAVPEAFIAKLRHVLRFDIELYNIFLENKMEISSGLNKKQLSYQLFKFRQYCIRILADIFRND